MISRRIAAIPATRGSAPETLPEPRAPALIPARHSGHTDIQEDVNGPETFGTVRSNSADLCTAQGHAQTL